MKQICFWLNDCEDNQQRMYMIGEYKQRLLSSINYIYEDEDLEIYMSVKTYLKLTKGSCYSPKSIYGMKIRIDNDLNYMEFRIKTRKEEVDNMAKYEPNLTYEWKATKYEPHEIGFWPIDEYKNAYLPDNYIINQGATILFYSCGKVISKRNKNDKFDKELGFLVAFFKKWWNGSKQSQKNVINSVSDLKTFMFEFFVAKTEVPKEKARKYLANLKVEKI